MICHTFQFPKRNILGVMFSFIEAILPELLDQTKCNIIQSTEKPASLFLFHLQWPLMPTFALEQMKIKKAFFQLLMAPAKELTIMKKPLPIKMTFSPK